MENKIKIIDEIVKRHPSYGVEKGYSHYTGGMKDSGDWYFRKMMDVPIEELQLFLDNIVAKENRPPKVYTEEELVDMKIVHKLPNGGFITEYDKKKFEVFSRECERKFFGL